MTPVKTPSTIHQMNEDQHLLVRVGMKAPKGLVNWHSVREPCKAPLAPFEGPGMYEVFLYFFGSEAWTSGMFA